jgi:exopolysaccharide biosynthesis polyprenyl glycosylphosphotransferase
VASRRTREGWLTLLVDVVTINLAWVLYYVLRVRSSWMQVPIEPDLVQPMVFIWGYWMVLFLVVGLYRPWYAGSRLDEIALLFKTTVMGCFVLFFAVFVDDDPAQAGPGTRILIAAYWAILLGATAAGRLLLRSIQRGMLISGIGVRNTVIVGSQTRAQGLWLEVTKYPALGYKVIGFLTLDRRPAGKPQSAFPFIGTLKQLEEVVERWAVGEVLIALDSRDHERLLEIVNHCTNVNVGIKIQPDLYDIISGQARTNQIYGFPLIDISPQLMTPWEESAKRLIDVVVAALVLVVGFPVWLLLALAIKVDSRGAVFYRQERVGLEGAHFMMMKFRSMYADAEKGGPQWANKRDPRVTRVGKILRKLHLDEIPQLWNILRGDMSVVGPRPERPMFVEQLSREIPMYKRRLKVRPGITGWAQVKHKYDESIEDVRKKVQYDLFYIENMSLRMDFKIILSTFSHMLMWKGH